MCASPAWKLADASSDTRRMRYRSPSDRNQSPVSRSLRARRAMSSQKQGRRRIRDERAAFIGHLMESHETIADVDRFLPPISSMIGTPSLCLLTKRSHPLSEIDNPSQESSASCSKPQWAPAHANAAIPSERSIVTEIKRQRSMERALDALGLVGGRA